MLETKPKLGISNYNYLSGVERLDGGGLALITNYILCSISRGKSFFFHLGFYFLNLFYKSLLVIYSCILKKEVFTLHNWNLIKKLTFQAIKLNKNETFQPRIRINQRYIYYICLYRELQSWIIKINFWINIIFKEKFVQQFVLVYAYRRFDRCVVLVIFANELGLQISLLIRSFIIINGWARLHLDNLLQSKCKTCFVGNYLHTYYTGCPTKHDSWWIVLNVIFHMLY